MAEQDEVINWKLLARQLAYLANRTKYIVLMLALFMLYLYHFDYDLTRINVNSTLVLQYIEALKWPLVIFSVLVIFRKQLKAIIERAESLSYKGAKIGLVQKSPKGEVQEFKDADPKIDDAQVSGSPEDNHVDAELEALLTNDTANNLYKELASQIFASQIQALRRLANFSDGMSDKDLQDLVDRHQLSGPQTPYRTVKALMTFVVSSSLVIYDSPLNTYRLTNLGAYFLRYIDSHDIERTRNF